MNILKDKFFIILNLSGIVINVLLSIYYYLYVSDKVITDMIIVNLFFLCGSLFFSFVFSKQNETLKSIVFVGSLILVCIGLIDGIIKCFFKDAFKIECEGIQMFVYLLVNIIYRLFFEKKVKK